jgi:hypothetical protein
MRRMGILAAIFALLVIILVVQRAQRGKVVVSGPAEVVRVEADKVTRVEIRKPDGQVELARTGDTWKLVRPLEAAASTDLVNGMLKSVEELQLVDVISSNPANRGTYQVDSTGTAVTIWSGEEKTLDMVVGKASADFSHTFVRRADSDEVYRAGGILAYNFNRRADDWRDKMVWRYEPSQLVRVAIEYPAERHMVTLVRADSSHWSVQEDGVAAAAADSATAANWVAAIAKLTAAGFATDADAAAADWSAPSLRLHVDTGGNAHAITFVPSGDEQRLWARVDDSGTIYLFYKSSLQAIEKRGEELRTGQAPPPAPAPVAAKRR